LLPRPPRSARGRRPILLVLAAATLAWLALAGGASAGSPGFGDQLLQNPGAEDDAGATSFGCNALPCPDPPAFDPPEQWAITGNFTAIQYAVSGAPAGPAGGGRNFFAGGYSSGTTNTATQRVPVPAFASQINATTVQANLSAQLAGYSGESASPKVTANFYPGTDCTGTPLGSFNITIAAAERTFTFLARSSSARVPSGTRLICVVMEPDGPITDYGDIYFDNLSLTLSQVPPLQQPAPPPPPATPPPPPATPPPPAASTLPLGGAPIPAPVPATTTVRYNPQTGQFFIRVQYRIKERALARLCARGCRGQAEIRTRKGRRLFARLPGDGFLLGSKGGFTIPSAVQVRIDIPIRKERLLDADFKTSGGFRVAETRLRVTLRTRLGAVLTVRDGNIRVSIERIKSGALPGLKEILAL
jgi:hypothetical protein